MKPAYEIRLLSTSGTGRAAHRGIFVGQRKYADLWTHENGETYWHTWDRCGVGGENGSDDTFEIARAETLAALRRQGASSAGPSLWPAWVPKSHGIILGGYEIACVAAGTLTEIRRPMKPQPEFLQIYEWKGKVVHDASHRQWCWGGLAHGRYADEYLPSLAAFCPLGQPGDRLWVREVWGLFDTEPKDGPEKATVFYRAKDGNRHELRHQLWRPAITMPRWASRLTLRITDARVETVGAWAWVVSVTSEAEGK